MHQPPWDGAQPYSREHTKSSNSGGATGGAHAANPVSITMSYGFLDRVSEVRVLPGASAFQSGDWRHAGGMTKHTSVP
jgi:hypothetical protein